jgi:hypothetical protein
MRILVTGARGCARKAKAAGIPTIIVYPVGTQIGAL